MAGRIFLWALAGATRRTPDQVVIGVAVPATAVDPHFFNASPNKRRSTDR